MLLNKCRDTKTNERFGGIVPPIGNLGPGRCTPLKWNTLYPLNRGLNWYQSLCGRWRREKITVCCCYYHNYRPYIKIEQIVSSFVFPFAMVIVS